MKEPVTKTEVMFLIDLIEKVFDRNENSCTYLYGEQKDKDVIKKVSEIKSKLK